MYAHTLLLTLQHPTRAGLDMCEQFMDVNDMIRDEDLIVPKFEPHGNGASHQLFTQHSIHNVRQLVANVVPGYKTRRPSARELNLLKRKAKISSKDQAKGWAKEGDMEATYSQDMVSPKSLSADSSSSSKVSKCLRILLLYGIYCFTYFLFFCSIICSIRFSFCG